MIWRMYYTYTDFYTDRNGIYLEYITDVSTYIQRDRAVRFEGIRIGLEKYLSTDFKQE